MGVPYKLFYRLGFHPWEDLAEHPPFAEKLTELFAREESGREPPYGPALDLGGGSAVWAVPLAKRGWQVTSVDIADKALERARERVQESGVDLRVMHADATELRAAGVGSDFRLVLDTGTFHGLTDAQRTTMGREMSPVLDPRDLILEFLDLGKLGTVSLGKLLLLLFELTYVIYRPVEARPRVRVAVRLLASPPIWLKA